MPVVFLCQNCQRRLKVTRRKIGTEIECPRCYAAMVVPNQEAAKASLAMADAAADESLDDMFAQFMVFDEPLARSTSAPPPPSPSLVPPAPPEKPHKSKQRRQEPHEPPPPAPQVAGQPSKALPGALANGEGKHPPLPEPRGVAAPSRSLGSGGGAARPRKGSGDRLLISRRIVYFQAVLICLLTALGLVGGFLIGRAVGPVENSSANLAEPISEIVGTIKYRSVKGEAVPDWQAVAIALPADKNAAIPVEGLGPQVLQKAGHPGETAIEDLGGAYARTLPNGNFTLRLPQPGRYHLLLISKTAERAKDRKVADNDLQQLRQYFTAPETLIGQCRYLWVQYELRDRLAVLHVF